jgi:hypothetical protein
MPGPAAQTKAVAFKPSLLLSLSQCLLLWTIHLVAREGLQPDLTGSFKDLLLLVVALTQVYLVFNVTGRWLSRGPADRQLVSTTLLLSLSFAIWLLDPGFQAM